MDIEQTASLNGKSAGKCGCSPQQPSLNEFARLISWRIFEIFVADLAAKIQSFPHLMANPACPRKLNRAPNGVRGGWAGGL